MKSRKQIALAAVLLVFITGCATGVAPGPVLVPLASPPATAPFAGAEEGFGLALAAFKAGDHDAAYRLALRVADRGPGSLWYQRSLFLAERSLIRLGWTGEAEAMMLRVQKEYPEMADYAVLLVADHHAAASRFSRAAALYQHVAERHPYGVLQARARFKAAQALLADSACPQAADVFERVLSGDPPFDLAAEAGMGKARALTCAMDMAAAVRAYQEVLVRFPGAPRDEEVERTLKLFRESGIDVPGLAADDLYERGRNLFLARQYDAAAAAFSAALEKEPAHPRKADMLLKRGVSLFHSGKRSEAAAVLERMVREERGNGRGPEALNWLGKAYSRMGEREKAVTTYLRIVDSYPESEWADDALYLIGNVYRDANDRGNALRFYDRLAAEYPDSSYADSAIWWRAWTHYTAGEYAKAEQAFQRLRERYPRSFLANQARYWQGRSCEKRGDLRLAAAQYRATVRKGPYTYYGALASERLANIALMVKTAGEPPDDVSAEAGEEIEQTSLETADEPAPQDRAGDAAEALAADPSYRTVVELIQFDMKQEAAAELWDLQDRLRTRRSAILGLSKALFELGDYYHSLLLMLVNFEKQLEGPAGGAPPDLWPLAYPRGYWESVSDHARRYGLDPYFIAAIIRQESHFQADALSAAGARGVMQVLPSTGEWAARTLRQSAFDRTSLYDADRNIGLGAWYVGRLMKRFGNEPALVAAAYNAGPGAVASWLGKFGPSIEKDELVESIPYTETRWYVKRVIANYAEYRRIYGRGGLPAPVLTGGIAAIDPDTGDDARLP